MMRRAAPSVGFAYAFYSEAAEYVCRETSVNRGLVASRWQESHRHSVELGRAHRFRLSGWRGVVKNSHSRIDVANRRVQALALLPRWTLRP